MLITWRIKIKHRDVRARLTPVSQTVRAVQRSLQEAHKPVREVARAIKRRLWSSTYSYKLDRNIETEDLTGSPCGSNFTHKPHDPSSPAPYGLIFMPVNG